jgi:DNA-binding Lrp family transcriptional regulator
LKQAGPDPGWDEGEISPRDMEVVRMIQDEGLSLFTFDGLRRMTGIHPETLSRTLERLEEEGVVERSSEGYSMREAWRGIDGMRPVSRSGQRVPILHTPLPMGVKTSDIVSALRGRWFDHMRWVGISDAEEGVTLKWVTDDGAAVIDARLSSGQLDVEAKIRTEADLGSAVRAAHQLVGRISKLYPSPRPGGRTLFAQIAYFVPYAM